MPLSGDLPSNAPGSKPQGSSPLPRPSRAPQSQTMGAAATGGPGEGGVTGNSGRGRGRGRERGRGWWIVWVMRLRSQQITSANSSHAPWTTSDAHCFASITVDPSLTWPRVDARWDKTLNHSSQARVPVRPSMPTFEYYASHDQACLSLLSYTDVAVSLGARYS
ncbi:hypothetical protein GY45DRAFT_484345 [Cubamyces sp. BRFM 1775]|nr:hypothetical protein GY45DRAFT_484345 [Cubamyces sp. BRFM 1775]